MSDQPDAGGATPADSSASSPAGSASAASGPHYGPVHRYGRPPDARRDGPPSLLVRTWAQPGPLPPPTEGAPTAGPWIASAATAGGGPSTGRGPTRDDHASWTRRVAASLVDALPGLVAAVLLVAGYLPVYVGFVRGDLTVPPRYPFVVAGSVAYVAALGVVVANRYVLAGRTGQSVGKRLLGIWLVGQMTGRPVGTLDAFVRDLLHVLDRVGGVGYLWPLWDDERQTLADKVAQTVVVRTPVAPLTTEERRPD